MERKDLVERLSLLSSEIVPLIEKHNIYSGQMDIESGEILPLKKVNPKNIQLRESTQALAELYPKAIEYVTLAELALELEDLNADTECLIKVNSIVFKAMIRFSKQHIDYAISKLPD